MSLSARSLRSKQRRSITNEYRGRGKKINNLWLIYSLKTDKDWILHSDRELIYWLAVLESNPQVATFDLPSDLKSTSLDINQSTVTPNAVVTFCDGHQERHYINANSGHPKMTEIFTSSQLSIATENEMISRVFTDDDLRPKVKLGVRWLKAIGYAAAMRNQECAASTTYLVTCLQRLGSGYLEAIINEMNDFDMAEILGLVVRQAIRGSINIDLESSSFGLRTAWRLT